MGNEQIIFSFYNFLILLGVFALLSLILVFMVRVYHYIKLIVRRQAFILQQEIRRYKMTISQEKMKDLEITKIE